MKSFIILAALFAVSAPLVGNANIVINGKICDDHGVPIKTPPKPPSKPVTPPVHTPTVPKPTPVATASSNQTQSQNQLQQQAQVANSSSKSRSSSKSNSTATGGSVGAISNRVGSSSSSSSVGATTSTSAGGDASGQSVNESSTYIEKRQTPPAFAGNVQPTASCRGAINGGASAPVAGISFGFSKKDDECDAREAAREFYEMGRPDLAIMVLCKTKVGKSLGDACVPQKVVAVVTQEDIDVEVSKRQHAHGFPNVNK